MSNPVLEDLKEYLLSLESYKRFIYLDEIINNDDKMKSQLNIIKTKQKELVNSMYYNDDYKTIEENYYKILNDFTTSPLVVEYIDLVEYFNQFINQITMIIEKEIN